MRRLVSKRAYSTLRRFFPPDPLTFGTMLQNAFSRPLTRALLQASSRSSPGIINMLRLILPLCDDRCVTDMALKSSKNLDWERIIYKAWPFPAKGPKLLPNPFGHSSWPDPKKFAYTFDHYAEIMNRFTEALGFHHYTLYIQDYGGPVGF